MLVSFRRFVGLCLFAVLTLIMVGSMVRSTGAGLGCPDWPKCFGLWVPPVSESQLPANYVTLYDGIAFNPLKTWTEYLNRLSGVVVGLLTTMLMVWAYRYRQKRPDWTLKASLAWVLVALNGGIGAWVVSSRLVPLVISIHMALAMALVVVMSRLYWSVSKAGAPDATSSVAAPFYARLRTPLGLFTAVFILQIVLGVELREVMDLASQAGLARISWLPSAGAVFWVHRSFSWVVLCLSAWLFWRSPRSERLWTGLVFGLVVVQMLTGAGLAYSGMLFVIQPLHLVLSACMLVVLSRLW